MIVCLCRVVRDRQIKDAIADGATTVDAICERTTAGTGCGACREELHSMLDAAGIPCARGGCVDCPSRQIPLASVLELAGETA